MVTAKQVMDWIYNVVLVSVAAANLVGAVFAPTIAAKWTFGAVGIAFSVAAFFFIRATIQAMGKVQK